MGFFEKLHEKRNQIIEIAQKHSADNVRIFGSVARGKETNTSDIDILIDIPDFSKVTFFSRRID